VTEIIASSCFQGNATLRKSATAHVIGVYLVAKPVNVEQTMMMFCRALRVTDRQTDGQTDGCVVTVELCGII